MTRSRAHIAEQRDLAPLVACGNGRSVRHEQDVGLDADRAQLLDRMLRRLGLQLAGARDEGHQRQMDVERVEPRGSSLPSWRIASKNGKPFDIADSAADLAQHEIDAFVAAR